MGSWHLLCIVAVVLAVWIGAAKDEKDGDRESLYENEDYGLGFWMPQGLYGGSVLYFRHGNGRKRIDGRVFAPEADMLIFSFWYLDKAYWENGSQGKLFRGCTDRFMRMRNGCCSAFL